MIALGGGDGGEAGGVVGVAARAHAALPAARLVGAVQGERGESLSRPSLTPSIHMSLSNANSSFSSSKRTTKFSLLLLLLFRPTSDLRSPERT